MATGRRGAGRALARALQAVRTVRVFESVGMLVAGALLLGEREPPRDVVLLVTAAVILVATALGLARMHREPFAWTVALAALWTVHAAARFLTDAGTDSAVLATVWAVLSWCAISLTANVKRLVAEHPDHRAARLLGSREGDA